MKGRSVCELGENEALWGGFAEAMIVIGTTIKDLMCIQQCSEGGYR